MPKLRYVLALVTYLAIPAVVMVGVGLVVLINPELARGYANYERVYHLWDVARVGVLWSAAALALALWIACCYLVLTSRGRSRRWLPLAAAGPFGFSVIAALEDRSPTPGDRYQHVIRNLKTPWRVALEIAVMLSVWCGAHALVVLQRELLIRYESLTTGTPIAAIVAQQSASSGMWAAGEGIQELYLVPLLYLVWPLIFNIASWLLTTGSRDRRAAGATTG
jgi:hypothetical protein